MMQAVNIIQDNTKQLYCIIDPLLSLQQAQHIPHCSLVECRYCKSVHIPRVQATKYECPICKCFTDLPTDYCSIVPISTSPIILTNHLQVPSPSLSKNTKPSVKSKQENPVKNKLRILIVCQSEVGTEFSDGLQCLTQIFSHYRPSTVDICFILYDTRIRLIQLEEDGRVIVVDGHSLELINDKYYPVSEESLTQLFTVISHPHPKTTLNSTKVISQILQSIQHSRTVVVWMGKLNQSTNFYSYPRYPNIDICCILKIPYSLTTHSQMQTLNELNKNSTRVKYILSSDPKKVVTQKIHYLLYDLLWNSAIQEVKVEGSRERKYPPEIITPKERVLGSLKNCIIVRLGKNTEQGENIQIRLKYTEMIQKQEQTSEKSEIPVTLMNSLLSPHKILIVSFTFHRSLICRQIQLNRYMELYKWIKSNPTNLQLRSAQLRDEVDIDISQFLRQCTYAQKMQLQSNIENTNCIYTVWPWIGIKKSKQDRAIEDRVKFVYYFTGYYINQNQIKRQKEDSNEERPYSKQIDSLNELCQVLYSQYEKRLPNHYQHIMEDIEVPAHLQDSDNEEEEEEHRVEERRYYAYEIK